MNNVKKKYTSKCSLYLHIKRAHREFDILRDGQEVPIHIHNRVKRGVDVYKVFKKAQKIKTDNRAELETDHTSNDADNKTLCSSGNSCNDYPKQSKLETVKANFDSKNENFINKKLFDLYDSNVFPSNKGFKNDDLRKDTMSTNCSEELTIKCYEQRLESENSENNGLSIDEILEIYESKEFEDKELDLNEEYDFNDWLDEISHNGDQKSVDKTIDVDFSRKEYLNGSDDISIMNFGCDFTEMHHRNTIAF